MSAAMASHETSAHDLARHPGITTTTLYAYINSDGTVKVRVYPNKGT